MTPQHVISQLLESDTKYPKNLDLLKKIIIAAYLARFRVNGLPPDNKIAFGNYLFDEERTMFDYTRLSDEKRADFLKWLLGPHQEEKEHAVLSSVSVNEYRGFTAEVALSWWGRLKHWLQGRSSEHWKINDMDLSFNYQLTGIEMTHGKQGTLIGFNQFLVPPSGTKYKDPDDLQREPLGNTKRVFITDRLVDQLIGLNTNGFKFETVCKSPHPHSVEVTNQSARFLEMHDYRKMQKFLELKAWYIRAWLWLIACFTRENKTIPTEPSDNSLKLIHEMDSVRIYQRSRTKEVLVTEKKPGIDNIVFCGGGAKIFAHVGVWKALNEAKIYPTKFAGSSAGAIMALLCYLGYSSNEITDFFKNFKQEHLVHLEIDRNGLSDPHSLKTALDYAITNKINQIVTKYNIPFPKGIITFTTLETLRLQCPDCGLGKELIVTGTMKRLRQTQFFSLTRSPSCEVSEAVKISASFPVLYRPTLIDGEEYNDGGVLSNFPTEAFSDDHTTFLESEYGNNLKVLAVQFDNGTERDTIDHVMDKVYKENFILNWIYRLLTGVSDPASGWEQDRMKLRKYAAQSVVVDVGTISSSSFSVTEESRLMMIENGYQSTKGYLRVRYGQCDNENYSNKELMFSSFSSLGDLLAYSCYRGNKAWFEVINDLIIQSDLPNKTALRKQSIALRALYFSSINTDPVDQHSITFFGNTILQSPETELNSQNHQVLLTLYPIFLKLSPDLVKTNADKRTFEHARHALRLHSPFHTLDHFSRIEGETHIILHVLINLIKELQREPSQHAYANLLDVLKLLNLNSNIYSNEYYDNWNLSIPQSLRMLKLFNAQELGSASALAKSLSRKIEPMQTITKEGLYCDDFSDGSIERNRASIST